MRNHRWAVGLSAAIFAGILFSIAPREPEYQGRPLTFWLRKLDDTFGYNERTEPSKQAIQAMGAKSIPYLLDFLQSEETGFEKKVWELAEKQKYFKFNKRERNRFSATTIYAFRVLGPVAKPALPEQIERLGGRDSMASFGAHLAIVAIGSSGVSEVEAACSHDNQQVRREAVRILMKLIGDDDEDMTFSWTAGRFGPHLPYDKNRTALIKNLDPHPNPAVRRACIDVLLASLESIQKMRSMPRPSMMGFPPRLFSWPKFELEIGTLKKATNDVNPMVRTAAEKALHAFQSDRSQSATKN